jgi:hypothetical protein
VASFQASEGIEQRSVSDEEGSDEEDEEGEVGLLLSA